ncbi:adenylosuccinate synthase [Pseudobacteriovorax antillogorgiicola]|uniref:Adenylosuccinate synthetase n=1 Tax=Pseudobacteriovorax antillogorgiicola TaxID=1513793 RepID=A0A1Y6BQ28_9BACT|nr:adenylosuccinate synthase [Pseudobacteriovorax antillogorgiicola]TCS53787.1 adenylosuccinate synthetase [Pseudobacteriovorax antillogorgiicola]SMF22248.1 Adenylosuccinate synthetase [Pseudobacteriovorax antillogorgiicola]
MGNVTILVGAQWGDEGKGKWIDILAKDSDIVARYQGGNNAGHTLYVDGEKVVLHQIPSGIFQDKTCALTAGVVVNPSQLVDEIQKVAHHTKLTPSNLWLSARAHVITPWHIYLDGKREAESDQPIGTTKRGIGPTYAEKANRTGLRLGDYVDEARRKQWLEMMTKRFPEFSANLKNQAADWEAFHGAASALGPYVVDAEAKLRADVKAGKRLLLEGAQGALLDINHGTYPFVTSSSTAAGGAFSSLGLSPRYIDKIYGVAKAYLTRVGEGPFPTELFDDTGKKMAEKGHEFGATTGRPRRCGWLDGVALRYCVDANGFDGIILNKMDILSDFDELKIAVAYEHPELGEIKDFPWSFEVLKDCKPIYKTVKGWSGDIPNSGSMDQLPQEALDYIKEIEQIIDAPVSHVGTGVNRQDALFR